MAERGVSEQTFYVVAALAGEPLHGYAVLSAVASLSDGRIRLSVGTLYGILDRLAANGTIEIDHEAIVDSRLRRYYRLTGDGRHLLTREATRQAANARMASERLAGARRPVPGTAP